MANHPPGGAGVDYSYAIKDITILLTNELVQNKDPNKQTNK